MGLTNVYTNAVGRIPDLFAKIRDGQAPDQFTIQLLKDWGFTSSNDRAALPLLKELGFLSPDGKPTTIYHEYRDHSRSKIVMAQALRKAYSDIFLIKEHPTDSDKDVIQGKFKSFHNTSDNVANLMTKTFFALLKLADLSSATTLTKAQPDKLKIPSSDSTKSGADNKPKLTAPSLNYNIQIHLPATKDVEVYNAIFKSLREHLINE